jgi:hypothetical protein
MKARETEWGGNARGAFELTFDFIHKDSGGLEHAGDVERRLLAQQLGRRLSSAVVRVNSGRSARACPGWYQFSSTQ